MPGPLEGVRVFDLTLWMVGPWASTQLGALGADVIHIEQPSVDPRTLGAGVPPTINGTSIGYMTWNQNKRGLFLDLKSPTDRQTAYELLQTCDVFLINMRPGAAERMGVGYEQVKAANPNIIYTAITGWGEVGPMRDKPGADVQAQYFTGFWSVSGAEGGQPEVYRHMAQIDATTGNVAAQAVLMGLLARKRTGQGQRIHVGMLRAGMALQSGRIAEYLSTETLHQPLGSAAFATAPDQAFQCQWGDWLGVSVTSEDEWQRFAAVMRESEAEVEGIDNLATDPRWSTNRDRVARRTELAALLQAGFHQRPRHYWMLRLSAAGIPCGYPISFETLQHHAQAIENAYLREVETSGWGKVWTGGAPWEFSHTPARWFGACLPGEHTGEILDELAARRTMADEPTPVIGD